MNDVDGIKYVSKADEAEIEYNKSDVVGTADRTLKSVTQLRNVIIGSILLVSAIEIGIMLFGDSV